MAKRCQDLPGECSRGTLEVRALLPPVTPGCSCWFPSLYKPLALQSLTSDPVQLPGLRGNGFPRQGMLLSALEFAEFLVSRQVPFAPSPASSAVPTGPTAEADLLLPQFPHL